MRLRSLIYCCLTLLTLPVASAFAQEALPPSSWQQTGPEAHAERFLDLMVEGKLDNAFKALLGNTKNDALDKLKFEIYSAYKKSGKPYGYEKILKQTAGKSVMRLRYVLLFKNMPKTFDIYYYNPTGQGWKLRTFSYIKDIKKIFAQ
ncbi:hypothetical protein GO013_15150 [Pseudodesulfovibrio sp. JC047]|uniref:hypothetical protein n=1 Tax=Pseudodesulfovibrio sp. JC047 TaxID=2683199 RepID=UPI0013D0F444|nr:hypothetical protein [Pseudodesulfovibrio sp. JC047]NDV20745.1 hypothetical protein [Pseudodesulfovibrio sp. JC047]